MKKIFVITLFLFVWRVSAQDQLILQFEYANNLRKTGQYFDAITEYKRLLFFDKQNQYAHSANFSIGICYKAGAIFDEAIKHFAIAHINSKTHEEKYSSQIEIVRSNILRRTTERALQILFELEKEEVFADKKDSINYWKGWAYIFADNWEKASESFVKLNQNHELKILSDSVMKDHVSVTFAKVISYILPGSGQVYTGNITSGLISLGWNLLSGFWTISAFNHSRAFDGVVLLTLVWQRFYRGNIQNAGEFAVQKNIEISNRALHYLQYEYKGTKP